MSRPTPHPDAIAECVLQAFRALPAKFKPRTLADGRREWVPLAGIVLSRGTTPAQRTNTATSSSSPQQRNVTLQCTALATGMRCLPQSKIPDIKGNVLHDWHAEILAIRGFNRWLLDECTELAKDGDSSERGGTQHAWIRWREEYAASPEEGESGDGTSYNPAFKLRDDVDIHMYCSAAPCGDASMELTMAAQEDPTPWSTAATAPSSTSDADDSLLPGRAGFADLGIVRRKPSRPDAPPTLSKSCSDKLALKQSTGLVSGLMSLVVDWQGCYLRTFVLPEDQIVREAVKRCFGTGESGRLRALEGKEWFRGFEVMGTSVESEFGRQEGRVGSNISALWTGGGDAGDRGPRRSEVLINGVLQGRKHGDPKGASCVSRRRIWDGVNELLGGVEGCAEIARMVGRGTYGAIKGLRVLEGRERIKKEVREGALSGWRRNTGDEAWRIQE